MILYTKGVSWMFIEKANFFVWAWCYANAMYQILFLTYCNF
jgi:hypothetical protein